MDNLVEFMNNEEMSDADPLIKWQSFITVLETIHPFYDGNGRDRKDYQYFVFGKEDLLYQFYISAGTLFNVRPTIINYYNK